MFNNITGTKKKTIATLATIALCGSLLVFRSTQSDKNIKERENLISDPYQPLKMAEFNNNSLFTNKSDLTEASNYEIGSRELYFKTILAVAFVFVLGIAALYVSKKLLPKITNLPGKEIHIVETIHLGPRKTVHILEIGNRRFLIGSTNENITTLADLNPTLTDLSVQEEVDFEKTNERQSY